MSKLQIRKIDDPWSVTADEIPSLEIESDPKQNFWAKPCDLKRLLSQAQCVVDFEAVGETVLSEYETIHSSILDATNILVKKGAKGFFWIATSDDISYIFQAASRFFENNYNYSSVEVDGIAYVGSLFDRWRIFTCDAIPENQMLIGVNNTEESSSHYAKLSITNFC